MAYAVRVAVSLHGPAPRRARRDATMPATSKWGGGSARRSPPSPSPRYRLLLQSGRADSGSCARRGAPLLARPRRDLPAACHRARVAVSLDS